MTEFGAHSDLPGIEQTEPSWTPRSTNITVTSHLWSRDLSHLGVMGQCRAARYSSHSLQYLIFIQQAIEFNTNNSLKFKIKGGGGRIYIGKSIQFFIVQKMLLSVSNITIFS